MDLMLYHFTFKYFPYQAFCNITKRKIVKQKMFSFILLHVYCLKSEDKELFFQIIEFFPFSVCW